MLSMVRRALAGGAAVALLLLALLPAQAEVADDQPAPGADDQPAPGADDQPAPGADDQPAPGPDQPAPGPDDRPVLGVVDSEMTFVNFAQLSWGTGRPARLAQALSGAGHRVVVLHDGDLDDPDELAAVDVILLPLVRVMDESAALALREWVSDGGALIGLFISPRMLTRPGCSWTGSGHPRKTRDFSSSWTCAGEDHGGFQFWARELNSAVWEYGPLSDVYQNVLINDPTPDRFSIIEDESHPIVAKTKAALEISEVRLDRHTGAGAEFVRLYNSNAVSILAFEIPYGTGSYEGVDASQYDGYTAAQAIKYGRGRAVYFDFSLIDFLPEPGQKASRQSHHIALELLKQSIAWATEPSEPPVVSRDARTWGAVDVDEAGIDITQKVVAEGDMAVNGTLLATIIDPSGTVVYEDSREFIGLYPGGPVLSYNLPRFAPAGGLRSDGRYQVVVSYVYSYPEYDMSSVDAVSVVRGQGRGIPTGPVIGGYRPVRVAGSHRYVTAAAVSKETFAEGVDAAYIATGEGFPDALAGGVAAGGRGPVLLVRRELIPAAAVRELKRLKPKRIFVLGGAGVISPQVESELAAYTSGPVTRLAGANRYATAAAISAAHFRPGAPVVFVATGEGFPDALAGGPAASKLGGPIMLTTKDALPTAAKRELNRLKPVRIVILGGEGVVSASVEAALGEYAHEPVMRLAGKDRYSTGAAVTAEAFDSDVAVVYMATGLDFPDALAGGAAAAAEGAPLLLTSRLSIPEATVSELMRMKPEKIVVLGGKAAVSNEVQDALATYLR